MSCIPPSSDCGCLSQVTSDCVFYKGDYLSCVDVTQGDDLTNILKNIDSLICSIPTPTGVAYVGTPNQIDVTGNVISLSSTVTTQISNLQSNVTALQSCAANTVKAITTTPGSGLTATVTNTNSCGRTINLNYTPPTIPLTQKQGIVKNLFTFPTVLGGWVELANLSPYNLNNGDVIKIKISLKRVMSNQSIDTINITSGINPGFLIVNDGGGLTSLNGAAFSDIEVILSVKDKATNKMTAYWRAKTYSGTVSPNYIFTDVGGALFRTGSLTDVTIDVNDLKLIFNNSDAATLEQFIIEIIRKV
jgi:hypothetical protein